MEILSNGLIFEDVKLEVMGVSTSIASVRKIGDSEPIVFLHGFGSTKEDYVDMIYYPAFAGRAFHAFDFPGCGGSSCQDPSKASINFMVEVARQMVNYLGIRKFHLVGHSMGGLTALLLAYEERDRVLSFTDIKGNLASEDCFLSRQIMKYLADDHGIFFEDFIERTKQSSSRSSALYAASLRAKVMPEVVSPIFRSMVELSDHGDLLSKFLALRCPCMFMYGEENASLSYLPTLEKNSVRLAEISHSGHFPMYSNPVQMWCEIGSFLDSVSKQEAS